MKLLTVPSAGSVGWVTVQGGRTGMLARPRTRGRRQATEAQVEARAAYSQAVGFWRLLSTGQQKAWAVYGGEELSGFAAYMRQALVALAVGGSLPDLPETRPPEMVNTLLYFDYTVGVFGYVGNGELDNPAGHYWQVQVARPRASVVPGLWLGADAIPRPPRDWVTWFVTGPGEAPYWPLYAGVRIPYGDLDTYWRWPLRARYTRGGLAGPWFLCNGYVLA